MANQGSSKRGTGKGRITRSGTGQGSIEISSGRSPARRQRGGSKAAPSGLERVFGAAMEAMDANRAQLNALDGQNGNHGDNMAHNMRVINQALRANRGRPPSEGLRAAADALQQQGQGGTGRYYALGLARAAEQFQGRDDLGQNDLLGLVQTLMGAVPSQGYPEAQASGGGSLLETLLGGLSAGAGTPAAGGGGLLEGLLSMATGAEAPQSGRQGDAGLGMGDLLNVGLSLLQAGTAGGGQSGGALEALLGALGGGGGNARSYGSAREASGGLLLQSVLQALLGAR